MDKTKQLEKNIQVLELELKEAKLKLEIERVKKTKVEEIIIERRHIQTIYPNWQYYYSTPYTVGGSITLQGNSASTGGSSFNKVS